MPRWAVLIVLGIALALVAALLPLPGVVGPLVYIGAVLCVVAGLIFLALDLFRGRDRAPMR